MSVKKIGEVSLKVAELPDELKEKIREVFKLNGSSSAGRPNFLQQVAKSGLDPYKLALEVVYMLQIENRSYDEVVEYLRRKHKFETAKSTIFTFIEKLRQAGLLDAITSFAREKVERKVRIFYETEDGFHSDIDYVEQFIQRKKTVLKPRQLRNHLLNLSEIVSFLRKLPHEWTEEDIVQFLNAKYQYYLDFIRKKAEEIKQNQRAFVHHYSKLSESELEARARENTRRYLSTIRVFLKWVGKGDLAEKFGHAEWKRRTPINDYLSFEEFKQIIESDEFSPVEKLVLKLHITLGCREGHYGRYGLNGLQWSKIDWTAGTIDVFESKTKGGTWWRGCYLNLFFPNLITELREAYEKERKNDSDYILESFNFSIDDYMKTMRKISRKLGRLIRAHYMRKTHAVWLIHADVPLEMIAGKPSQAVFGVGWEDLTTLLIYYGSFSREKISRELDKIRSHVTSKFA